MAKNLDIDDGLGGIYPPNGDINNVQEFGYLYTREAAERIAATIDGWHFPAPDEYQYLIGNFLTKTYELKDTNPSYWTYSADATPATNSSGFGARAAGIYDTYDFIYSGFMEYAVVGRAFTEYKPQPGPNIMVSYNNDYILSYSYNGAFSVRLIKDYSHTPTINITGESTININVGDTYTDAGATASDTRYGDITSRIITVNNVNTAVVGTYTVTYNVTTEDGYSAAEVVRSVVVEGNSFNPEEVTIGTQTWMAKNLDIDDGLGGIYAYNNDEGNVATYGRLYTWDAAVRLATAIDGWHLPTDAEWNTLSNYLGGNSVAGGKLKETGTAHWRSPNTGATNSSGFTALPAGFGYESSYSNIYNATDIWTATQLDSSHALKRSLYYSSASIIIDSFGSNKLNNFSVRLIKD